MLLLGCGQARAQVFLLLQPKQLLRSELFFSLDNLTPLRVLDPFVELLVDAFEPCLKRQNFILDILISFSSDCVSGCELMLGNFGGEEELNCWPEGLTARKTLSQRTRLGNTVQIKQIKLLLYYVT